MNRYLMLAVPLMLMAVPAVAQQSGGDSKASGTTPAPQTVSTGAAATPVAAAAPVAKPKKICRSFTVTGSRISDTVCRTKDQWAAVDAANEAAAKRFQDSAANNAGTNTAGSGGGMGGVSSAAGVIGLP